MENLIMNTKLKCALNATWKVGLGLIGLTALGMGLMIASVWYDKTFGRDSYCDRILSQNIVVEAYNNNRMRVKDIKTGKYTTPKVRWVSGAPERDSITVYCDKDGYRGYLNCNTGRITLDAGKMRFRRAWQFSEGRAFVVLDNDKESLSLIDYNGNVIARDIATYVHGYDYVFVNGVCRLYVDGRFGLLSLDGTWAVEPTYYDIGFPNTFGYRIACDEEGYWILDTHLNRTFSEPYDKMDFAIGREEGAGTLYRTKNHVKQLVNYDGSVVEPFVIDGTYNLKYMVRYNEDAEDEYVLDPDLVVYQVDGWEGLMNKHTGRIITPAAYTDFEMISKELIKAVLGYDYNDESVVMDRNGRIVKQ